jgi:Ca2+-binding EF-hand superfamily protein
MSSWLPFAACCALLGAAFAQAPTTAEAPPAPREPERTVRGSCSEAASRDLFTMCDADGDDRLDMLEAGAALDALRTPRDVEGFAALDRDRDGYVSWPEFDACLRQTLQRGATFRVRPLRPAAMPTATPQPATPVQKFIQAYDSNQNGSLDRAEVEDYVRKSKLSREVGAQLWMLDVDHNGRLDEAELAPWLAKIMAFMGPPAAAAGASLLSAPWAAADRDRSQTIDANELATVLRRLDPSLAVWAAELLRALDRNHDGVLQPEELPGFKPARDKTAAALPVELLRQLPLRIPVR